MTRKNEVLLEQAGPERLVFNGEEDGLRLIGEVLRRTRRLIGADKRELITYTVRSGLRSFELGDWESLAPFAIGTLIDVPVYVRAYVTRGGGALTTLQVDRPSQGDF